MRPRTPNAQRIAAAACWGTTPLPHNRNCMLRGLPCTPVQMFGSVSQPSGNPIIHSSNRGDRCVNENRDAPRSRHRSSTHSGGMSVAGMECPVSQIGSSRSVPSDTRRQHSSIRSRSGWSGMTGPKRRGACRTSQRAHSIVECESSQRHSALDACVGHGAERPIVRSQRRMAGAKRPQSTRADTVMPNAVAPSRQS